MTGIERLRRVAEAQEMRNVWTAMLSHELSDIADQIERERACDADTIENIRLIVGVVIDDMECHVLGHEGAEDSPVARWARELREAIKSDTSDGRDTQNPSCVDAAETADVTSEAPKVTRDPAEDVSMSAYDLLPSDEREAIAWVRERGGIEAVKEEWNHSRNFKRSLETAQARVVRQQRHIEFVQRKCRERQEHIVDLNKMVSDMRLRLMPEGMEWLLEVWPRWSNGEYCRFGDWWKSDKYGVHEPEKFRKLSIYTPELLDEWGQGDGESYGYEWDFTRPSDPKHRPDKVEPPEPVDTWQRIEDDVMADAKDYCESRGISSEHPKHSGKAKCEDLVRRCRALAERERGE